MKWIDSVRGNDSIREVARKAGINQATLNRQVNLDILSFDVVRDIARAYGRPALADLVTTGHLSAEDVGVGDVETALHAATDEQLVLEIARRLDTPQISALFDKPISHAIDDASNVHQFQPRNVSSPSGDLAEVASDSMRLTDETDEHFDNA